MEMRKCTKESFTVIGKEGSTKDGNDFIGKLWEIANIHFNEVEPLAKKDKNNCLVGFWGLMSDFSRKFNPWEENFTKGLYLAGVEVNDLSEAPKEWDKWVIPGFEYLYIPVSDDRAGDIKHALAYIAEKGERLVGAIQDFSDPRDGRQYMYFPINKI